LELAEAALAQTDVGRDLQVDNIGDRAGGVEGTQKAGMDKFREDYKKKFGIDVQVYAPYVYDSMPSPRSACPARAACQRPCALRAVSSWPCMRISAFHVVSPCRTATIRVTSAEPAPLVVTPEAIVG